MNGILSRHVLIPSHSVGGEVIVRFYLPMLINLQLTNIGTDTGIDGILVNPVIWHVSAQQHQSCECSAEVPPDLTFSFRTDLLCS